MYISTLTLSDFRNFSFGELNASRSLNVICGENAQGKTNILESIYYLSLVSSFRAAKDSELVRFGADSAHIHSTFYANEREQNIKLKIPAQGRREMLLNGVKIGKKSDIAGNLRCVLFCPEDLELIRGSSALRRAYMDEAISQLWPNYISYLAEYKRLFAHKTRILKDSAENPSLLDTLDDFSAQMCRMAAYIIPYRERFCERAKVFAGAEHEKISSGREKLELEYKTVSTVTEKGLKPQEIYELLWQHYISHKSAEIASCSCLSGPHKDDINIFINSLPAKNFASQGQTRTAALSLKLAQRELFRQTGGEYPILLLDDVLSELDRRRQEYLLGGIEGGQVFITTCESDACARLDEMIRENSAAKLFHVKQGCVE